MAKRKDSIYQPEIFSEGKGSRQNLGALLLGTWIVTVCRPRNVDVFMAVLLCGRGGAERVAWASRRRARGASCAAPPDPRVRA